MPSRLRGAGRKRAGGGTELVGARAGARPIDEGDRSPGRRILTSALAALVLGAGLLAGGCGGGGEGTGAARAATGVTAASSPAEVVLAYLGALQAGDVAMARALLTDRFAEETDRAVDSWFRQEVRFAQVAIGAPVSARGTATAMRYARSVNVPVRFDLIQAAPVSLPNGPTVWGFTLGRDRGSEPWRIDGAGRG